MCWHVQTARSGGTPHRQGGQRNLNGRPPVTDIFGKSSPRWLAALPLPCDERDTVEGCVRQVDFLDHELAVIDRATTAAGSRPRRRAAYAALMTDTYPPFRFDMGGTEPPSGEGRAPRLPRSAPSAA